MDVRKLVSDVMQKKQKQMKFGGNNSYPDWSTMHEKDKFYIIELETYQPAELSSLNGDARLFIRFLLNKIHRLEERLKTTKNVKPIKRTYTLLRKVR